MESGGLARQTALFFELYQKYIHNTLMDFGIVLNIDIKRSSFIVNVF